MKFNKFLFGAAALSMGVFASCSSDEPNKGGSDNGLREANYLAVNIVTPKEGSRATDGGFEAGSAAESNAKNALFLLYDAAGNEYMAPQAHELTLGAIGDYDPNVERISTATLIIEKKPTSEEMPANLLVVLNPSEGLKTTLTGKSIDEAKTIVANYGASTDGAFVMSNSAYSGAFKDCATSISGPFATTPEAAKADPVDVYVERVVAKIRTNLSDAFETTSTDLDIEGKKVTLTPDIQNISIANVAKESNLFKNITGINYTWNWNDAANFRSYWAVSSAQVAADFNNQSYNQIGNNYNEECNFYVQENTSDNVKTSVIVSAILKDGEGAAVDFAYFGGRYYTIDGYQNLMLQQIKNLGYRIKTANEDGTNTYSDFTNANIALIEEHPESAVEDQKGWEAWVQLTDAELSYVKYDAAKGQPNEDAAYTAVTATEINGNLSAKANRCAYWKNGLAYYFVEIEHFGTGANGATLKGIVRNHIYDLNLTGIKGLGSPVFDPEEVIVPENRDDEENFYYLAARINILKWKVVKQDINFGE